MNMKQKNAGFTLVEIAIVLVVIGLLLGGVLKGQELIENAKIRNLRNDFEGISAGFYAYQDRYRAMPGDDAGAAGRGWTDATAGNGNGALANADAFDAGNGDNQYFWQHLRYASLITGNPAGTTANAGGRGNPTHAFNGKMGVSNTTATWGLGLSGHVLCAGSVPGKAAASIDATFDDGLADTGQLRAILGGNNTEPAGTTPATSYLEDGASFYTICKNL